MTTPAREIYKQQQKVSDALDRYLSLYMPSDSIREVHKFTQKLYYLCAEYVYLRSLEESTSKGFDKFVKEIHKQFVDGQVDIIITPTEPVSNKIKLACEACFKVDHCNCSNDIECELCRRLVSGSKATPE